MDEGENETTGVWQSEGWHARQDGLRFLWPEPAGGGPLAVRVHNSANIPCSMHSTAIAATRRRILRCGWPCSTAEGDEVVNDGAVRQGRQLI